MAGTGEVAVAPQDESSQALFTKLSPGPGMSASEVAAHQRARLQNAMIELVAERGYDKVSLRELAAVAKVSTRAFYEHFRGKEDCFLNTHEVVARRAVKTILAAQAGERDWEKRLRLAFRALVRWMECEPAAARLALIEVYADGTAARVQARRVERTIEATLADGFRHASDGIPVSPLAVEGIVAGIITVARRHLLSGEPKASPGLADDLLDWTLGCLKRVGLATASPETYMEPSNPAVFGSPSTPSSKTAAVGSRSNMAERDLILAAVAKLAAGTEADGLTVSRIRAAAGVSRRSFDAHFEGVGDCLFFAVEQRVTGAIENAVSSRAAGITWQEGVHKAVTTLCAELSSEPLLESLCVTGNSLPGPDGLLCSMRIIEKITRLISAESSSDKRAAVVSAEATAGMIWGIIAHRVLAARAECLVHIAPELGALAIIRADTPGKRQTPLPAAA